MITLDPCDVLERFALLTGLSDGVEQYLPFCSDAASEVEQNEKPDCPDQAQPLLIAAAAALANYRHALAQAGAAGGSFSAGDVKVSPETDNLQPAKQLWRGAAAPPARDRHPGAVRVGGVRV